jgi:hypothetical protein
VEGAVASYTVTEQQIVIVTRVTFETAGASLQAWRRRGEEKVSREVNPHVIENITYQIV